MKNVLAIVVLGILYSGCTSPDAGSVPEVKEQPTSSTEQIPDETTPTNAVEDSTVIGTYTYIDGAHSFVPCGSAFNKPVIPGSAQERLIALAAKHGGSVVVKLEAHTVMGETSEGDDAEEYLAVDKVLEEAVCP